MDFNRQNLPQDPFLFLEEWLEDSRKAGNKYYNAMTLATINKQGQPDARIVLYKGREQEKIKFYTNYQSPKAQDLAAHPECSVVFFWPESHRQVRLKGVVTKMSKEDSQKYFYSRPRSSQISATISPQSQVIPDRHFLEKKHQEMEEAFKGKEISFPDYWGGYYIAPQYFEFWIGQEHRLHDRFTYTKKGATHWEISQLAP